MYKPHTDFAQAANDTKPAMYQGGFTVILLDYADIPAFLALQDTIRGTLSDANKHHLKERTYADLVSHLDAGMPLIGVKTDDGKLVGQVLMSFPDNAAAKNLEGYPIRAGGADVTAVIQSVAIHPDFRGKAYNLSKILHEQIVDLAHEHSKTQLLAKVSDTNPASQKSFLGNGFTTAATGKDPVKGYTVTFFGKDISVDAPLMHAAASPVLALAR